MRLSDYDPGYANCSQRLDWMAYDLLHSAWQGEMGGSSAEAAYRGFVEQGLVEPPESPFRNAADGWLLGSPPFVDAMRERMKRPHYEDDVPAARRLSNVGTETVLAAVAEYYGVSPTTFQERGHGDEHRDVAAWLTRRWTTAPLRELAELFGLSHPGSVSNLLRRVDRAVAESSRLRREIDAIQLQLRLKQNEKRGLTPIPQSLFSLLCQVPGLTYLDLCAVEVSQANVDRLRECHPSCRIRRASDDGPEGRRRLPSQDR